MINFRKFSSRKFSTALMQKMEEVVAKRQVEVKEFMKTHKDTKLGEITVGQVVGGMRGMPGMLYETSKLHPLDGIQYRGHDLFKIRDVAPKAVEGGQPIPEGVLWLLLTGEFPNDTEVKQFQEELFRRG
jgi:citrate synthase